MKNDDIVWSRRSRNLVPWLWRAAYCQRTRQIKSRAAMRVYALLMQSHRWCWVHGVRL